MSDGLRSTLDELVRSRPGSNPAFDALVGDFARYHLVLALVGGAFLAAFVGLGCLSWSRFRRAGASGDRRWTFARTTYLAATVLSVGVGLLLALIVVANVSTAADPRPGFAGAVPMIGAPAAGSPRAELQGSFDEWLQSGSTRVPETVQRSVDDRVAWQRPKAIICVTLLLGFAVLGARTWRSLLASRERGGRWRLTDVARLALGLGAVAVGLLLMLMVMGNTQAAVAPRAMTLFFG